MFILARHLFLISIEQEKRVSLPKNDNSVIIYCQVVPNWYDLLTFVLWFTEEDIFKNV